MKQFSFQNMEALRCTELGRGRADAGAAQEGSCYAPRDACPAATGGGISLAAPAPIKPPCPSRQEGARGFLITLLPFAPFIFLHPLQQDTLGIRVVVTFWWQLIVRNT